MNVVTEGFICYQRRDSAIPASKMITIKSRTPPKDPMSEPEIRLQKELNCWQMANQFVFVFPLWAKYTMAADADAPAVNRASMICGLSEHMNSIPS